MACGTPGTSERRGLVLATPPGRHQRCAASGATPVDAAVRGPSLCRCLDSWRAAATRLCVLGCWALAGRTRVHHVMPACRSQLMQSLNGLASPAIGAEVRQVLRRARPRVCSRYGSLRMLAFSAAPVDPVRPAQAAVSPLKWPETNSRGDSGAIVQQPRAVMGTAVGSQPCCAPTVGAARLPTRREGAACHRVAARRRHLKKEHRHGVCQPAAALSPAQAKDTDHGETRTRALSDYDADASCRAL